MNPSNSEIITGISVIVSFALVVIYVFYSVKKNFKRSDIIDIIERELANMKQESKIKIRHSYYDSEAIFLAYIGGKDIHVRVFKNGVKEGNVILDKSAYICKIN